MSTVFDNLNKNLARLSHFDNHSVITVISWLGIFIMWKITRAAVAVPLLFIIVISTVSGCATTITRKSSDPRVNPFTDEHIATVRLVKIKATDIPPPLPGDIHRSRCFGGTANQLATTTPAKTVYATMNTQAGAA